MGQPDYNIKQLDLSTATNENAVLELDQEVRELTVLTRGGLAYIAAQSGGPWIPIRGIGQSVKFNDPIRKLYWKHTRGSGSIELLVSGGGTSVCFSGGGAGAAAVIDREVILAHFSPRLYTGAFGVNSQDGHATDELAFGTSGGGTASVEHDTTKQLHGFRVRAAAAVGAGSSARINFQRFSPSLFTLLNAGTLSPKRFARDFYLSFSDLVYATKTATLSTAYGAFGFGFLNLSLGAFEGQHVGFYFDGASTVWEAVVRDVNTGIIHRQALTGYLLGELHDLELRIGCEAGSPYVRWWADGVQAYELNLPLGTAVVRHTNTWWPHWSAGRQDNTEDVDLWGALGAGATMKLVYPAAA